MMLTKRSGIITKGKMAYCEYLQLQINQFRKMKNAKKYIKLYEDKSQDSFNKWGYYYPPRSWDEFYAWDNDVFERYLTSKDDDVSKVKSYIIQLDTLYEFGFYEAFQPLDFKKLNDVLFQVSKQMLLNSGMTGSGTDHCNVLLDILPMFAANRFEVIDSFLPQKLMLSKGTYYTEVAVNLIQVMYYNDKAYKDEALEKAEKFLTKKITLWEKFVVLYLIALLNRKHDDASRSLQELCSAYQKFGNPKSILYRCFSPEIHGLYRFAKAVDEDFFYKLISPKHHCFSEEFEVWQKENSYPQGNIFYKYPSHMDFMNKILEAEIPTVELTEFCYPNGRNVYKDVDRFAQDLTRNVVNAGI